jgi:hypothetical protein
LTLVVCLAAHTQAACIAMRRDLTLPDDDVPTAMVLSSSQKVPVGKLARHPWFVVRGAGESEWERWEIVASVSGGDFGTVDRNSDDAFTYYSGYEEDVRIHGMLRGAQAQRFIDCLRTESPRYRHRDTYRVWPGPNSNTYVDYMLRKCNMHADLPSTAIGKDYRGIFGVSWTSGGTGFQIETPIFGIKLGVTEGVEIHLFSLAFGIDLWPPAIIVPIDPGRIGFEDR